MILPTAPAFQKGSAIQNPRRLLGPPAKGLVAAGQARQCPAHPRVSHFQWEDTEQAVLGSKWVATPSVSGHVAGRGTLGVKVGRVSRMQIGAEFSFMKHLHQWPGSGCEQNRN